MENLMDFVLQGLVHGMLLSGFVFYVTHSTEQG